MVLDKRSLHLRLQEYCDCYLETDPKRELEILSKKGPAADVTGDPEETAIKFLGLAILYGLKESAKKVSFTKAPQGEIQLNIEAAGKYKLPAPSAAVADQIFNVMRGITHLEGKTASEPLALGIKTDRFELGVAFDAREDKQTLSISFPEI